MQEVTFARYDTADYLKSEEDIGAYFDAVMEEAGDDPAYVARALGTVARARNMTALAREVGMSRVGLNKAAVRRRKSYTRHRPESCQGAWSQNLLSTANR